MKTVKKLLCLAFAVLLSLAVLSACIGRRLPEDYVPAPEEMGEREGNYIYYGAWRMKTTGGQREELLDYVEIDGENIDYMIIDGERVEGKAKVTDWLYNGDDTYFCVTYGDWQNCIVKYNLLTKAYKIVYRCKNKDNIAVDIRIFRDDIIIVANGSSSTSDYFIIDHEGNVLQSNANEYRDYIYIDDYIINVADDKIEFRHWSEKEFTVAMRGSSLTKDNTRIVLEDGVLYIRKANYYQNPFVYLSGDRGSYACYSLFAFNISTQKLTTLFQADAENSMHWINTEYYMTYETFSIRYIVGREKGPNDKKWKDSYVTSMEKRKCVLYKINPDLSASKIYTFDAKKDFTNAQITDDGYMNISSVKINEKTGHSFEEWSLNLKTLKLNNERHKAASPSNQNEPELDERFVCNGYYYYQSESQNYFYLHRSDLKTNEEKIMQYYLKGAEEHPFGGYFRYRDIDAIRNY